MISDINQMFWEKYFMQSLDLNNYYNCINDFNDINEVSVDIETGWSSACLDETIDYYINCNASITQNKENSVEN
uniref:Uncharacterized protein n=1 Tax=Spyridia filamentosa TaxID=196632 RepID=A0A1Z1MKA2_SPYFI|nr:hypothetical protein [Spyridia filamentosa]ARW66181.1 hypothetical protein [Spyridia filamentosa]